MKAIIVNHPHPACILNLADPARAYVKADHTDVAATWKQHSPVHYGDDYDLVERDAWMELPGEFK